MRVVDRLIPAPSLVVVAAIAGATVALLTGSVAPETTRAPQVAPALDGVPQVEQAVRLVPVLDGELVTGFVLEDVRAGSLWHRMGLANGDEVQDLYGFSSFHTTDQLDHHELVVNFVRAGEPLRVEYAMPPTTPAPEPSF